MTATDAMTASTLKVAGATLHFEVRGVGPLLLVIAGGPQDAGVFAGLARRLADDYTVVTYDPRGNSRSRFDGAPMALDLDVQGDDAAALIGALGGAPAFVFGTSGGAQIGFNLAARHPRLVRLLLAHEPPALRLLDDPTEALAAGQALHDTYRRDGVEAAMAEFFASSGLEEPEPGPDFEPTPEDVATFERVSGNFEYWLACGMLSLSNYLPDIKVLRRGGPRIVVGLGEDSRGLLIDRVGMAAAARLGGVPLRLPGDHLGFEAHAEDFATALRGVLV